MRPFNPLHDDWEGIFGELDTDVMKEQEEINKHLTKDELFREVAKARIKIDKLIEEIRKVNLYDK